jgi:hypothetical protein
MDPLEARDQDQETLHLLQAGERVELSLDATDYELRVTDRRLLLLSGGSVRFDIPYDRLRRIEFDIETDRPATLLIVPHLPTDEPQALSVPHERLRSAAELLAFVGERLRTREHSADVAR